MVARKARDTGSGRACLLKVSKRAAADDPVQ